MGWIVDVGDREWKPLEKPVLPYELKTAVDPQKVEELPPEFREIMVRGGLTPDTYEIRSADDLDLDTGYLNTEEIRELLRSLPLEITYADRNDRVVFFSESRLGKGFVRTKTVLGRRVEFCHPPRLEKLIRSVIDDLKSGKANYREFWTRIRDRVVRVLIVAARNDAGEYLGAVEIVEDLTEVINRADEIKKRIVVL
ncbi:MAG: PAS domain-containing protein [Ignisphaera sp.]|nr:PAS domain-containing protein [Ignisphaera sp.]MDW8085623.1 PAS domain-containing protein [Ignisphaera sp.]